MWFDLPFAALIHGAVKWLARLQQEDFYRC